MHGELSAAEAASKYPNAGCEHNIRKRARLLKAQAAAFEAQAEAEAMAEEPRKAYESHSKRPFNLTSQQLAKQQLSDHNAYRCEVDAMKMASLEYHDGLTGKAKKRSAANIAKDVEKTTGVALNP